MRNVSTRYDIEFDAYGHTRFTATVETQGVSVEEAQRMLKRVEEAVKG